MQSFKRKENGITLIALVVTIVVLIILATISINAVLGENGIIRRAEQAREHQANAEAKDNETMNELDEHLANVMGENNGDNETEIEPTDPKYFEYTFDEENETAEIIGGNPDYCVIEEYYIPYNGNQKGIKYIQDGDTKITNIVLPSTVIEEGVTYSVTSISDYVFCNSEITSIIIPDNVTDIGKYTFYSCSSLTNVTIPNSVTSIGSSAFKGCTELTEITIPNSVTSIGGSAFEGCTELTEITIPDNVTSIEIATFDGCTGLTNVTISDSVTSIGYYAFRGCTGLTSITIPNNVTSIMNDSFSFCSSLTEINVKNNNEMYSSENGVLFNKNKTEIILYPIGKTGFVYTIPESVTSIGSSAFSGCSGLTSVTIPDSVTSIGSSAFYNCSGLTNVTIDSATIAYSISYNNYNLVNYATTIYIKDTIPEASIGVYIRDNYTKAETSDKEGYIKYTR